MTHPPAIACDLSALDNSQRVRRRALGQALRESLQRRDEVPDGYAFYFQGGASALLLVAEFAALERLCCPFLEFSIHVPPAGAAIGVTVSGPPGSRDFLRDEFELRA